jgi:hypothetical protein
MNMWHLMNKMVNHHKRAIPARFVVGSHAIATSG